MKVYFSFEEKPRPRLLSNGRKKEKLGPGAEYLSALKKRHGDLATIVGELDSPAAYWNKQSHSVSCERVTTLRAHVADLLKSAQYNPADGRWLFLSHVLNLVCTASGGGGASSGYGYRWAGARPDLAPAMDLFDWKSESEHGEHGQVKPRKRGKGQDKAPFFNARTEEEWKEYEREWFEDRRLKLKVEEWKRGLVLPDTQGLLEEDSRGLITTADESVPIKVEEILERVEQMTAAEMEKQNRKRAKEMEDGEERRLRNRKEKRELTELDETRRKRLEEEKNKETASPVAQSQSQPPPTATPVPAPAAVRLSMSSQDVLKDPNPLGFKVVQKRKVQIAKMTTGPPPKKRKLPVPEPEVSAATPGQVPASTRDINVDLDLDGSIHFRSSQLVTSTPNPKAKAPLDTSASLPAIGTEAPTTAHKKRTAPHEDAVDEPEQSGRALKKSRTMPPTSSQPRESPPAATSSSSPLIAAPPTSTTLPPKPIFSSPAKPPLAKPPPQTAQMDAKQPLADNIPKLTDLLASAKKGKGRPKGVWNAVTPKKVFQVTGKGKEKAKTPADEDPIEDIEDFEADDAGRVKSNPELVGANSSAEPSRIDLGLIDIEPIKEFNPLATSTQNGPLGARPSNLSHSDSVPDLLAGTSNMGPPLAVPPPHSQPSQAESVKTTMSKDSWASVYASGPLHLLEPVPEPAPVHIVAEPAPPAPVSSLPSQVASSTGLTPTPPDPIPDSSPHGYPYSPAYAPYDSQREKRVEGDVDSVRRMLDADLDSMGLQIGTGVDMRAFESVDGWLRDPYVDSSGARSKGEEGGEKSSQ
ncbi:hypothetical protein D9613_003512 [Agrocybe pediades]|uniref:Uncharacterized protein n=1 Tax=Agrocybe pediades TaxID=84607 RepID=A0A8H4QPQ6_9AGAR|nr:hypothetical protein D9613_003512 [Agrocybe pediades]